MSDFTGFSFNGIHSSSYNILRVSNDNRYEDNILPTMQDKTIQIPGGDGSYFFNTNYTQRTFNLKIAYDSVSENNIRQIRQWLGDKEIHSLVFDELPYKTYYAKCTETPKFQYVCFDKNHDRVYKGEADISFTCFDPFAHCLNSKKYLNQFDDSNKNEWALSSGLLSSKGDYDGTGNSIKLYNPGDVETNFYAYYNSTGEISITLNGIVLNLNIASFKGSTPDTSFRINSRNHLIEGIRNNILTGNLYNDCIISGDFAKIPCDVSGNLMFISSGAQCVKIEYDYLYL